MRPIYLSLLFIGLNCSICAPCDAKTDTTVCGAECVFIACQKLGYGDGDFKAVLNALGKPGKDGYSLKQLETYCMSRGASAKSVKTTLKDLQEIRTPVVAILHLKRGHYAILHTWKDDRLVILDVDGPTLNEISADEWSGVTLLLSDRPIEFTESHKSSWLVPSTTGLVALLAALMALRWRRR